MTNQRPAQGVERLAELDLGHPGHRDVRGGRDVEGRDGMSGSRLAHLNSILIRRQMPRASGMISQIVPEVAIWAHCSAVGW